MKSKQTATLLAFFLGGLGAHKFYLGQTGMGILYLLTAGLLGIGAFVNFIQLIAMNEEKFNRNYNYAYVNKQVAA
ncbi:MAG: TM2 domain-containing protein [Paramuribaculum sp.]|nr:TM2 domain-containing protein [Paramuribaculum sp.]